MPIFRVDLFNPVSTEDILDYISLFENILKNKTLFSTKPVKNYIFNKRELNLSRDRYSGLSFNYSPLIQSALSYLIYFDVFYSVTDFQKLGICNFFKCGDKNMPEKLQFHRSTINVDKENTQRIKNLVDLRIFKNVPEFLRFISLFQLLIINSCNPEFLGDLDTLAKEIGDQNARG